MLKFFWLMAICLMTVVSVSIAGMLLVLAADYRLPLPMRASYALDACFLLLNNGCFAIVALNILRRTTAGTAGRPT